MQFGEQLSAERAEAIRYYNGEPFGDEEPGRSQVVSTDVRDSVASVLPSMCRVVWGSQPVCEFAPSKPSAIEDAKQQTEYIADVLEKEGGFLKLYSAMKDGLVSRIGIVKWWHEEGESQSVRMEGQTREQLVALASDPDVEIKEAKERYPNRRLYSKVKQAVGLMESDQPVYDVDLVRHEKEGRLRIEAIPPNEFVFSRQARGREDALVIGHRTELTKSELLSMGIDEEDIDGAGGDELFLSEEELARRGDDYGHDPEAGEANGKATYFEGYMPLDADGDGIAELRKVCTLGDQYKVIKHVPADSIDMAWWSPDPEPHVLQGSSWADRTKDVQRIKSAVLRATLDSASSAVFPRMLVEKGQAEMGDVLNTEIGAIIRHTKQGSVQPLVVPFVGKEMFAVLAYMDDVIERRTGRNKAAAGLDADALQSTTKSAADAAVQGSTEQVELLIRMFCEQLLKPLFYGLRQLTVKHPPRQKMVRLRGKWVPIDPANWAEECDVHVNVAIGSTLSQDRPQRIGALLAKQELILSTLGIDQPVVSPQQYSYGCRRFAESLGEKDLDSWFSQVAPDWKPPEKPPQQDPATMLALAQLEVEKIKNERELAIAEAELALKQKQFDQEMLVEVATKAAEIALERERLNAEHAAELTNVELQKSQQAVEGYLAAEELDLREKEVGVNAALAADQQEKQHEVAKEKATQKPAPKKSE